MGSLHVVGVRHHSPACARLVQSVIAETKPKYVLIEGPSDMNERMGELELGHELPIAIFSYAHGDALHHASWSPFCAYSPEWVAITTAKEVGAAPLFIDLPAWDPAFLDVENRYSDRHGQAVNALCERLGIEDMDALWDHLFEQPLDMGELRERLAVYFRELRAQDTEPQGRDLKREAFMAKWIQWALTKGDVVVVCGGYHAPVFEELSAGGKKPTVPELEGATRTGSYLVPYSFHRLDSFVGYESGMPSPEYYQRLWDEGSGEPMLFATIQHLRKKKQRVSPADAIAAMTLAQGLRVLRGHRELARVDILDGIAAAVVKDALESPLPWNRRGKLLKGTDPMLVEIVAAFSGERLGKLAPGTPHPPLVADAMNELANAGIELGRVGKDIDIVLTERLAASRVLHRLRVLGIPGFQLVRAPSYNRDRTVLAERWKVSRGIELEPALIEASAYGATLETAAAAKLDAAIGSARGVAVLAAYLREAALVGIQLITSIAEDVRRAAGVEASFPDLGVALDDLVALHEHDVLLGAKGAPIVLEAIKAAFDRGLWLFEGIDGDAGDGEVKAALALRNALRRCKLDRTHAVALMARRAVASSTPPALRGAAYGFSWSLGESTNAESAIRSAARPETLGDFLAGLFALAREEILHQPELLAVIDGIVGPMTREDFLIAIPSLRMAFAWFPPREKEEIARIVLAKHGGGAGMSAQKFLRPSVSAGVTMAGMDLDQRVDAIEKRFGL